MEVRLVPLRCDCAMCERLPSLGWVSGRGFEKVFDAKGGRCGTYFHKDFGYLRDFSGLDDWCFGANGIRVDGRQLSHRGQQWDPLPSSRSEPEQSRQAVDV